MWKSAKGLVLMVVALIGVLLSSQVMTSFSVISDIHTAEFSAPMNQVKQETQNETYLLWPTIDYSQVEAILNGFFVGPSVDSLATKPVATIVTMYYNMPSRHGHGEYLSWMKWNLFDAMDPIVLFVDPRDHESIAIAKNRTHAPTLIVTIPVENLTLSKAFDTNVWRTQYAICPDKNIRPGGRRDLSYYLSAVWNGKKICLRDVAMVNPFNTEYFIWIDAGYFRNRMGLRPNRTIVQVPLHQLGVPVDKFFLYAINKEPPFPNPYELNTSTADTYDWFAAGVLGGTRQGIEKFYKHYFQTVWEIFYNGYFIGNEQWNLAQTCRRHPSVCFIHNCGRGYWFCMRSGFNAKITFKEVRVNSTFHAPLDLPRPPLQRITHFKPHFERKAVIDKKPK